MPSLDYVRVTKEAYAHTLSTIPAADCKIDVDGTFFRSAFPYLSDGDARSIFNDDAAVGRYVLPTPPLVIANRCRWLAWDAHLRTLARCEAPDGSKHHRGTVNKSTWAAEYAKQEWGASLMKPEECRTAIVVHLFYPGVDGELPTARGRMAMVLASHPSPPLAADGPRLATAKLAAMTRHMTCEPARVDEIIDHADEVSVVHNCARCGGGFSADGICVGCGGNGANAGHHPTGKPPQLETEACYWSPLSEQARVLFELDLGHAFEVGHQAMTMAYINREALQLASEIVEQVNACIATKLSSISLVDVALVMAARLLLPVYETALPPAAVPTIKNDRAFDYMPDPEDTED